MEYQPRIREIRIHNFISSLPQSIEEEVILYCDQMQRLRVTEFIVQRHQFDLRADVMKLAMRIDSDPEVLTWLSYGDFEWITEK